MTRKNTTSNPNPVTPTTPSFPSLNFIEGVATTENGFVVDMTNTLNESDKTRNVASYYTNALKAGSHVYTCRLAVKCSRAITPEILESSNIVFETGKDSNVLLSLSAGKLSISYDPSRPAYVAESGRSMQLFKFWGFVGLPGLKKSEGWVKIEGYAYRQPATQAEIAACAAQRPKGDEKKAQFAEKRASFFAEKYGQTQTRQAAVTVTAPVTTVPSVPSPTPATAPNLDMMALAVQMLSNPAFMALLQAQSASTPTPTPTRRNPVA